jgi:hypothetical protein
VQYTQDGLTQPLTAVPGRTAVEMETSDGVVRTDKIHDFIVEVAELAGITPRQGDRITWDQRRFEVMSPGSGTGGKVYEEEGPYKQLYRIHTKEIAGGS